MKVSNRVGNIEYAIRDVLKIANEIKGEGHDVIQFNIGDPLKFDYEVPNSIQEALGKLTAQGHYSDSLGELVVREKIANFEGEKQKCFVDPNNVIYFQGVSEGMLFTFLSFINPGDRVLVPGPTYPAYQSIGTAVQAEVVAYKCIEEDGWKPDIDDMRSKITDTTKLVVVINPNNPTGAVYSESTLKSIRDVVGESSAAVISDEIYDLLVLDGKYTSFSSIANDVPSIIFNGFSKVFLAPGYRAAYGYKIDTEDRILEPWEGVKQLCRVRLSSSTPISLAAIAALQVDPPHVKDLKNKIRERRDIVVNRIDEIERITAVTPKAAFYIFPKLDLNGTRWKNDKDFVIDFLREKKALLVYGSGFGVEYGKDHFRMVYLSPPNILEEGMNRLDSFIASG